MGNLAPVSSLDETDRHAAVHLKILSPTFIKWLENLLSFLLHRNGGYAEITIRFAKFRVSGVHVGTSFNEQQWRNDYLNNPVDMPIAV